MQSLIRFALLALCILGLSSFAQAQVVVSGKVLNGTTGLPVPGLSVFLLDDAGQSFPPTDVTSLEGDFFIGDIVPDTWYTVEVYSDDTLRYTDYIFIDGSTAADNTVTLPEIVVAY